MAKSLRPGQLNPISYSLRNPIATPDKIIDDPMSVYRQSLSNLMNPNVFEGVTEFKAQVLHAFPPIEEEASPLWNLISSILPTSAGASAPKVGYCICRIPEIHQTFIDPNLYEDGDSRKAKALIRHPIFELNFTKLGISEQAIPGPGSIVTVSFSDSLLKTGEITNIVFNSGEKSNNGAFGGTRDAHSSGRQINGPLGENQAIWVEPTNGREINKIILHVTMGGAGEGKANDTIRYFAGRIGNEVSSGQRKVSVHYAIDQNGTIVQGVEEKDIAQHAKGANSDSIGIEMTGNPGIDDGTEESRKLGGRAGNWPPGATGTSAGKGYGGLYAGMYTEELIEGVAKLCAEICDRYNIEINRQNIIGHEDLRPGQKWGPGDSLNRKYGETTYWNWDDFITRVKGYSAQVSPQLVEELYGPGL